MQKQKKDKELMYRELTYFLETFGIFCGLYLTQYLILSVIGGVAQIHPYVRLFFMILFFFVSRFFTLRIMRLIRY
jgi:hypothetical protein